MIWHDLATVFELLSIAIFAYILEGAWSKGWMKCVGIGIMLLQVLLTHFTIISIPTVAQCLIVILWLKCLYWKKKWCKAIRLGIYGYGGMLLYLQAFYMLWLPESWYAAIGFFPTSMILNSIVCGTVCILCVLIHTIYQRVGSREISLPVRITADAAALAMIVACQLYREQVMVTYRLEAKIVIAIIIIGMVVFLICCLWDAGRQIGRYRKQVEQQLREQHDYEKRLSYVETMTDVDAVATFKESLEEETVYKMLGKEIGPVLRSYKIQAEKADVKWEMVCSATAPYWNVTSADAMTIVGNLLENAIRATKNLEKDYRWIKVELDGRKNMIRFSNPYSEDEPKDESHKGYGTGLVQEAISKNGGELIQYRENGLFVSEITWCD